MEDGLDGSPLFRVTNYKNKDIRERVAFDKAVKNKRTFTNVPFFKKLFHDGGMLFYYNVYLASEDCLTLTLMKK